MLLNLALYKELLQLQDLFPCMAHAVLKKMQNHTWYLTLEMVVFSLSSGLAKESEKAAIAQKLLKNKEKEFHSGKPKLHVLYPGRFSDPNLVVHFPQTRNQWQLPRTPYV